MKTINTGEGLRRGREGGCKRANEIRERERERAYHCPKCKSASSTRFGGRFIIAANVGVGGGGGKDRGHGHGAGHRRGGGGSR